jgi:hypothetical protein
MNPLPAISQDEFETLLAQHRQLIQLTSDLEYQIYRLGELPPDERLSDCQRVGGSLIGLLRDHLFRQDQQVLPILEALLSGASV